MRGDPRVEIGGVARAHGIRGEVVVVTHDPDDETLATCRELWIAGARHAVESVRPTPKGWLVVLAGCATRDAADALRGKPVEVAREALGLGPDDVLLNDLVGCAVRTVAGAAWGTIAAVDAGPLQDLLVIHDGGAERLLPMVDEFVVNIDLAAGVVTVEPPEGLPVGKADRIK
jgi:16S rRNA processing protein RimM